MKNVCLLYLLLIGLSACGGKKTDSISLSGEIKGLGNDTIYLYGADRMHDRMDTLIAEKDKFSATLSADTLVTTILLFSDGTEYPLFLNKGNKIQIKGSMAELSSLQISGNAPNKELTDFNQDLKGLGTPSGKALEEKAENFITEHPASLVSIYLLDKYFVQNPQPDLTQIQKLADRMTGELKDRPFMDALLNRIEEEEKVIRKFDEIAVEMEKIQKEQSEIHESNLEMENERNRLFNDLGENPNTLDNKNFALLGISLDLDKKKWQETIKADTLKWEQACDFSGWSGEIIKQFAIQTLPTNILLSPTGRIEGKNLDEKAIENKLKEIAEKEKEKKKTTHH